MANTSAHAQHAGVVLVCSGQARIYIFGLFVDRTGRRKGLLGFDRKTDQPFVSTDLVDGYSSLICRFRVNHLSIWSVCTIHVTNGIILGLVLEL